MIIVGFLLLLVWLFQPQLSEEVKKKDKKHFFTLKIAKYKTKVVLNTFLALFFILFSIQLFILKLKQNVCYDLINFEPLSTIQKLVFDAPFFFFGYKANFQQTSVQGFFVFFLLNIRDSETLILSRCNLFLSLFTLNLFSPKNTLSYPLCVMLLYLPHTHALWIFVTFEDK